jgi:hypothetical protein
MSEPLAMRSANEERRDIHNVSVDEQTADADLCGRVDLRTGRICRLPALHQGGCDFTAPKDIRQ